MFFNPKPIPQAFFILAISHHYDRAEEIPHYVRLFVKYVQETKVFTMIFFVLLLSQDVVTVWKTYLRMKIVILSLKSAWLVLPFSCVLFLQNPLLWDFSKSFQNNHTWETSDCKFQSGLDKDCNFHRIHVPFNHYFLCWEYILYRTPDLIRSGIDELHSSTPITVWVCLS